MIDIIITLLIGLGFGLGISLTLFGVIFCYRVFYGDSSFENPLIPMAISFVFIAVGLTLLYLIFI